MAAEGRPRLRAAVGGLRRVLALDFQVGFPAGAVVLFIHWRWQPTGAGDLFFMDRRWPSDAEAAAGRPRPRAATLGHAAVRAQELLRVNHFRYPHARARGARCRFQIAVSFFSFSGATPALPRLAALAAAGAGGGAQSRPSYAVAAEGRPRLRAAVGGLRRVLALDFQVGFPAGAVVLFIHWRWQPTGAGDLFFMDRRWPSDAEAAAGRPRPRAATLGHAAVRAQELLRVNHFRYPHARARGARRRFQIAVSFFSFSGATPALPRLAALAAAGAGGGAQSRPSYAVAAEGRPRLRAAVGGLRRVLALDFQAGFPAGAVGLFIHWRWQPTGAGDLAIIAKTRRLLLPAAAAQLCLDESNSKERLRVSIGSAKTLYAVQHIMGPTRVRTVADRNSAVTPVDLRSSRISFQGQRHRSARGNSIAQ